MIIKHDRRNGRQSQLYHRPHEVASSSATLPAGTTGMRVVYIASLLVGPAMASEVGKLYTTVEFAEFTFKLLQINHFLSEACLVRTLFYSFTEHYSL